jgi:hypothetical protein
VSEQKLSFVQALYVRGRKLTALSFIVMILVANFWFILRFTGGAFPNWSQYLFFGSVFFVAVGFFMMLPNWINPLKTQIESDDDGESTKDLS